MWRSVPSLMFMLSRGGGGGRGKKPIQKGTKKGSVSVIEGEKKTCEWEDSVRGF